MRRSLRQPEPEPDLTIPVGIPTPAFTGELSADAIVENRTGTYGGRFVYAILGEVDTFNPVEPKGATDQEIRALVFSGLVNYNNGSWQTGPELAKSWDVSDDNLTWTFYLREGIRWSDGEPVTIDDALFSFQAVFHDQIAIERVVRMGIVAWSLCGGAPHKVATHEEQQRCAEERCIGPELSFISLSHDSLSLVFPGARSCWERLRLGRFDVFWGTDRLRFFRPKC